MPRNVTRPVAVAVVSWNTRDLLRRCLESLHPHTESGLVEVWVVDNASRDGSADLVRDGFGWVNLIASDENLGFGRAVNLAARQSTADWIAPSNADIAVRRDTIDRMLEAGERDAGAGAVAPMLSGPDGETQHSVFSFPTIPYSFLVAVGAYHVLPGLGDRLAIPGFWDPSRSRRVPWAIGAFLMVRRAAWDEIGGFDDRQWMYAEDLDLGWRLHSAGWATRYEPRAIVDHAGAASTSQLFGADPSAKWQRATFGFIARRWGVAHVWAIALLNLLGALLRWTALAVRSRGSGEQAERRRSYLRWATVQLRALRGRTTLKRLS